MAQPAVDRVAVPGATHASPRDGRPPPVRRPSRKDWTPLVLLIPALLVLLAVLAYPLYQLGLLSVLDYRQAQVSGGEPVRFLALGNYRTLVGDSQFWEVLVQTVAFAAVCVLGTLAVGAALAVLMTRVGPGPRLALSLAALAAWAAPAIIGSTVWMFLFDTNLGLVNRVLTGIGFDAFADFSWTYDRYVAFGLVAMVVVWHSFPFVMITLYAGIRAIPDSVLEAAVLDGASPALTFRKVVVPMMRPLVVIVTIQSVIWDFKIFTQIYVMTEGGGVAGQNLTMIVYAYQKAFATQEYGLGSAIGTITVLILLVVTLVYLRVLRRSGEEL